MGTTYKINGTEGAVAVIAALATKAIAADNLPGHSLEEVGERMTSDDVLDRIRIAYERHTANGKTPREAVIAVGQTVVAAYCNSAGIPTREGWPPRPGPTPGPAPTRPSPPHTGRRPMTAIARLTARPHYTKAVLPGGPNASGISVAHITATEATQLVREHLSRDTRLRNVKADPAGAVSLRTAEHTIRMEPCKFTLPKRLTARQAEDLREIAHAGERAWLHLDPRAGTVIHAGLTRIPPAATERLVERGWLVTEGTDGARVSLSLAGVVALEWRALRESDVPAGDWGDVIAEAVADVFTPEPPGV